MNDVENLFAQIATTFSIVRGTQEPVSSWKQRILYSFCGRTGYAALWDANGADVSIKSVRLRMERILCSCVEVYPETEDLMGTERFKEIYKICEAAGLFYHRAYHVRPAVFSAASVGEITFLRGESPHECVYVSGIGGYRRRSSEVHEGNIYRMFQMEEMMLSLYWEQVTKGREWVSVLYSDNMEFLREENPNQYGYWQRRPNTHGNISLLWQGKEGGRSLYFYHCEGNDLLVSGPLSPWMTAEYRHLANACLFVRGTLPPIRYRLDGELVYMHLGYLLPRSEENFLKLYSWEADGNKSDFFRICTREVFEAVRVIFAARGFSFEEE